MIVHDDIWLSFKTLWCSHYLFAFDQLYLFSKVLDVANCLPTKITCNINGKFKLVALYFKPSRFFIKGKQLYLKDYYILFLSQTVLHFCSPGDGLTPEGGHPPLGQRLSAPPLTQPPSPYPVARAHLAPPSPCLSIHSAGCPVHQPCPVHTPPTSHSPCPSHSSCPSHTPCPSHNSRTCPHGCPDGHSEYDWTDSESENDDDSDPEDSDYDEKPEGKLKSGVRSCFSNVRKKIEEIVESKYFMQGILISILINTLSMGIEFHGQVWNVFDMISFHSCFCHLLQSVVQYLNRKVKKVNESFMHLRSCHMFTARASWRFHIKSSCVNTLKGQYFHDQQGMKLECYFQINLVTKNNTAHDKVIITIAAA